MGASASSRRDFLRQTAATTAAFSFGAFGSSERLRAQQGPAAASSGLAKRRFGKTGMDVTPLGFGGAEIGFEHTDQATVSKLLNTALDAGLNVVDTAECYVESEALIGAAVGHRRKEFFLFTKCGHWVEGDGASGWSKAELLRSIERSLGRLKTDAVDLVQLHSCSLEVLKKGECIEALELAKQQGKTRFIGYSGDSAAARYAVECGRFDALQTSINVCDQESIELTLPLAAEKGMGIVAKRPIANVVWRHDAAPANGYHLEYWKRLQELRYDFAMGDARKREDADGPVGVALRFTAMQPGVGVLIVGTTKPERWKQNAGLLQPGPLPEALARSIRARWKEVARSDWTGQT
ncbi:MAG: aldo/keto reductase [Planctomycetes bacterium]|nr:aldo/keto reductase [Planctomycetota bacterium]